MIPMLKFDVQLTKSHQILKPSYLTPKLKAHSTYVQLTMAGQLNQTPLLRRVETAS